MRKREFLKKCLSLCLSSAMVVGMLPAMSANAAELNSYYLTDAQGKARESVKKVVSDNHEIIDINMKDGKTHKVTIYLLDEDDSGRWSMVDVIDPDTQKLFDTQNIYDFSKGVYLSWNISGHMQIRLTNVWTKRYQKSKDTAIHGIFIDGKDARADGSAVVMTEEPEEDKAANSFESINVLGRYAKAGEKFTMPFDKQIQSVELRFNGNIDPSSENLDKVKVLKDGNPVKGEVRSSFNSVTFVPEETMKDGKYTVQIPADLKNSAGQTLGKAATAEFEVQTKVEVVYFRDGMNYMARRVELAYNDRLAYTGSWDDNFADLPDGKLEYQDGVKRELKLWKSGNHGGLLYEIDDEESILPSGTYKFTLPAGIKSVSGAVSAEPYEKEFKFNSSQLSAKINAPSTVKSGNAFALDVKECIGYGELRYAFSEEALKKAAYQPVKETVTVTPEDGVKGAQTFYVQFRVVGEEGTESPTLHKKMRIGDVITEGEKYPFDMQKAGAYDKDGFGSDRNPMDGVFDQSTNVWSASASNYIADGEDGLSDRYDQDKDSVITTEKGIEYHLSENIYRDGGLNVATGNGKEIPAPKETKYDRIYVLAAGKNNNNVGTFTMKYKDGTSTTQDIDAHYWADAGAYPENVVFDGISACYGWKNNRIFPDGVMRQYELIPDDDKVLTSVVLPKTKELIRVFAMTGKEIDKVEVSGEPVMAQNAKNADTVSCQEGKTELSPEESDPTYDEFIEQYGADAELRGAADVTDVTNIQEVPAGEREYDQSILMEKEEETGGYGQGLYPYVRQPEKLMSYKIRMQASEDYELDIEDALEAIRRVDNLSRGLDKKCYLVGWQTNGHDTGFPYFGEVNPRHRRPMDKTALDSLKWLIQEAKKYHTTITLHVNFSDAYTDDDPISQEMVEKQIPIREENGEIRHSGRWARHVGFIASAYANYFTGNWQKNQIDPLVKMLPELEGQSVHPDAWYSWSDPYYKLNVYDMTDAQRRHAIYMRKNYNMDLTTEFDFQFGAAGDADKPLDHVLYFPMIWQSGWSDTNPMQVPSYFQSAVNQTTWDGRYLSAAGRYFGEGSAVEPNLWDYWDDKNQELKKDGDIYMYGLKQSFAEKELTRQYLNTLLRASMEDDAAKGGEAALYTDDGQKVSSIWNGDNTATYKRTVKVGDDVVLQEPGNVFMPMTWRPELEIQAWSKAGYENKSWKLPVEWEGVQKVDMYDLSLEGLRFIKSIDVKDGAIQMSMNEDQTAVVVPAGSNPNSTKGFAQNGSVEFLGRDTQTGANWTKSYGKEGYDIFEKETHIPAAIEINFVNSHVEEIKTGYVPENPDKPAPEKIEIAKVKVGAISAQKYTGKALTPAVSVTYNGKKLVKGSDYKVSYRDNTNIGTAKAVIIGIGKYKGSITKSFSITVKKNSVYTVGNYKYKITTAKTNGKGTVSLTGVKSKDLKKTLKKITVGATVKIGGKKFNVTEIGSKAFSDCQKVTSASVGANVTKIGASAFSGCKKLKEVKITSKKLKSVGKNAFKNISSKAKIKVPKAKKKAYAKILKSKGQKKSVKITA